MTYLGFTCPKCGARLRFDHPLAVGRDGAGILMTTIHQELHAENMVSPVAIAELATVYALYERGEVFASIAAHRPKIFSHPLVIPGPKCGFEGRVELETA